MEVGWTAGRAAAAIAGGLLGDPRGHLFRGLQKLPVQERLRNIAPYPDAWLFFSILSLFQLSI